MNSYYDYDEFMKRYHDPDDTMCRCSECVALADSLAADHAYDLWKERGL